MIPYLERTTRERKQEQVYGGFALKCLYHNNPLSRALALVITRVPLFSQLYGWWQTRSFTRRKIAPFIERFGIDTTEFLKDVGAFESFNAFFCRELKPEARPIDQTGAIIPADGRFLAYARLTEEEGFVVKGRPFSISKLLCSDSLAEKYARGSLLLGRLCPSDYHRFHFPCTGVPSASRPLGGALYSVNPLAIRQRLALLTENKRMITELDTEHFGTVLCIEVGATNVGTIHQTYTPGEVYRKGEEKGYFSFGGSALILLFEEGKIQFSPDLLAATKERIETRCLLGQFLGR